MNKLKQFWTNLRGSFWFLPTLILAASVILAVGMIEMDSVRSNEWTERWPHVFGASAEGARGMLSTIAGSMMTVVGVTFSMTLVTLTLASSQYTSRILRNFMRDRATQIVLGIFAGIFTYCLIVLRTISGGDEGGFVPNLAVSVGVLMAIGSIGVLIFFIHHIASSIQASSIINSVADETLLTVNRLFPDKLVQGSTDEDECQVTDHHWQAVPASKNGYIQNVDKVALLHLAREQHTTVRMEHGIGEFVVQGNPIASLALDHPLDNKIIADLQATYTINRYRTMEQDAGFGIRQLVDIALRALSSGVNDTTTAVTCLDYLTAILARLASRSIPLSNCSEEGELRLIVIGPTFAGMVADSFDQIRESAKGNAAIMLRMLGALQTIASQTTSLSRRLVLRKQADYLAEVAKRTLTSSHDRTQFEHRLRQMQEVLKTKF